MWDKFGNKHAITEDGKIEAFSSNANDLVIGELTAKLTVAIDKEDNFNGQFNDTITVSTTTGFPKTVGYCASTMKNFHTSLLITTYFAMLNDVQRTVAALRRPYTIY